MLPEELLVRASLSEDKVFWTHECEELGVLGDPSHPEWRHAEFAAEPTEALYAEALRSGMGDQPAKEFFLRQRLWWARNDGVRRGLPPSPLNEGQRQNLEALERHFSSSSEPSSLLLRAEMLRELSVFEAAMSLLHDVPFADPLAQAADQIYAEAERQNPFVFQFVWANAPAGESPTQRSSRCSGTASYPMDTPGVPRPAEDRKRFYDRPEAVATAIAVAETVGLGVDEVLIARNVKPGGRVLDAGCGVGRVALGLWKMGFRQVEACDFAPAQVAAARARLASHKAAIPVLECDFRSLPVPDGHYDAVLCLGNTLAELFSQEERDAVIKEFARAVSPEGVLLFTLPRGAQDSDLAHIMSSPRFVPSREWSGGGVCRDIGFGKPSPEELGSFGWRCYHSSTRLVPYVA